MATSINAVSASAAMLTLLAVLLGCAGLLLSSEAALGPTVAGFGCIIGIWARIAQAAGHHRDLMRERDVVQP